MNKCMTCKYAAPYVAPNGKTKYSCTHFGVVISCNKCSKYQQAKKKKCSSTNIFNPVIPTGFTI